MNKMLWDILRSSLGSTDSYYFIICVCVCGETGLVQMKAVLNEAIFLSNLKRDWLSPTIAEFIRSYVEFYSLIVLHPISSGRKYLINVTVLYIFRNKFHSKIFVCFGANTQ